MRQTILVIAGDTEVRGMLARWLMTAGYQVELAGSGRRARYVLANHKVTVTIVAADESVALEGLAEPVRAWRVVGLSAVASRFEALRAGGLTPLIGWRGSAPLTPFGRRTCPRRRI